MVCEIILGVVILVIIILVAWIIKTYNNLVQLRNKVKDQWSQVDVQLKKRFDLIPNIVETVKGYAKHESQAENVHYQDCQTTLHYHFSKSRA